jgi:cytochrome c
MRVAALLVVLAPLMTAPAGAQDAPPPEGAQIFQLVCAMCHSVNPPPKAAPPISHAAAYYLRRHGEVDAAMAAMVTFLKEPSAETSAMPPHAVERFGLMPPQDHLTDAQLRAVALYSLSLADTVHVRGRPHVEGGHHTPDEAGDRHPGGLFRR